MTTPVTQNELIDRVDTLDDNLSSLKLADIATAGSDIVFTEDNTAFTEVGTDLTITDGIASGFTTSDYIQADESPFYSATDTITSFETVVKFTTTGTGSGVRGILYQEAADNTSTVVQIYWYYSAGSGGYKVGVALVPASGSAVSFEAPAIESLLSRDNWLKLTWSSTETAKLYYSTDGISYTMIREAGSVVSALRAPNNKFALGYIYNYGSPSAATDCSIDLNKSYMKVNGVTWTPYVPMKTVISADPTILKNSSTGTYGLTVGTNTNPYGASVSGLTIVGQNISAIGTNGIVIGATVTHRNGNNNIKGSTTIGAAALNNKDGAICLGAGATSADAGTFNVGLSPDGLSATRQSYVLLNVDGKIPGPRMSLQAAGAPTTSTVGSVGQFYVDTTNQDAYICVDDTSSTYTWKKITP